VPPRPTHLLYLHGFRSSPKSFKAQRLHAWLEQHQPTVSWWCPQLPPSPAQAMALVEAGIAPWPVETTAVLGSSLGGYYATWLAEKLGCPAVLLNPAVYPARDLAGWVGEQRAYHDRDERLLIRPGFIDELRALERGPITKPERYFVIIAKGDEVLDWREMLARYPGANVRLIEGSDHSLTDFDEHLPHLLRFLVLDA
jgi:hypothetical protein